MSTDIIVKDTPWNTEEFEEEQCKSYAQTLVYLSKEEINSNIKKLEREIRIEELKLKTLKLKLKPYHIALQLKS